MAKWLNLRCAALAMLLSAPVCAYEPSTHNILSQQAVAKSRIAGDPSLMLDLGLGSVSTATFDASDLAGQIRNALADFPPRGGAA